MQFVLRDNNDTNITVTFLYRLMLNINPYPTNVVYIYIYIYIYIYGAHNKSRNLTYIFGRDFYWDFTS
jgi:hypothetical protein